MMASSNDSGPNYLGYYKEMVFKLFSGSDELLIPHSNLYNEEKNNDAFGSSSLSSASASLFRGGLVTGISDVERERLKGFIDHSIKSLKYEIDKILDQIVGKLEIDSKLECRCLTDRMLSSCPLHISDASNSKYMSFAQVHDDGLQPNEPPDRCDHNILAKTQKNLEEFLDVIMSKCRPMTYAEKQQLGQRICSLPKKAQDRVVEIIQYRNQNSKPLNENHINLDEEEDVTLWRLYTYVEIVKKANNC